MTTSTDAEILPVEAVEEKPKDRTIDEIWDLPYSELTDSELESLIAYKSAIAARDALYSEKMRLLSKTMEQAAAAHMEVAQAAMNTLQDLTAHAVARFQDAS